MLKTIAVIGVLIAGLAAYLVFAQIRSDPPTMTAPEIEFSPAELLAAGEVDNFARINHPHQFDFPADYGRHGDYRSEWWQISGVLKDTKNRNFAFLFIVFRVALGNDRPPQGSNDWSSNELYLGLLSISDAGSGPPRHAQRISRGGIGLADWQSDPMQLWIDDWEVKQLRSNQDAIDLKLTAGSDTMKIDLELHNEQPLVDANSVLGDTTQATPFTYYIQPRMRVAGTLVSEGDRIDVLGTATVEHAWGELPLPGGATARDRFSLYLEDGRSLFLFRNHRVDGSGNPSTGGILVSPQGMVTTLSDDEVELDPTVYRTGVSTAASYPAGWELRIPRLDVEVELVTGDNGGEVDAWSGVWLGHSDVVTADGKTIAEGMIQLDGYQNK